MQIKPTLEQRKIIKAYSQNFNIKIEANAGCGKTSTCLFLAQSDPSKQILLLTFNRQLADDSKHKFQDFPNVSVSTVHGFIKSLYAQSGFDTQMLFNVLSQNIYPVYPQYFDVLILDEFQDFSVLMVKLIFKSLFFINKFAQLIILGCYHQCIYEFFNSDIRFLKYCDSLFTDNNLPWKTLYLSKSFRLTPQMQCFINSVILHQPHFSFNKSVIKLINKDDVIYWIGDPYYDFCDWFEDNIIDSYRPDQIFILGPSVTKNSRKTSRRVSPIVKLQYFLSNRNYPVYVSDSMSDKSNDNQDYTFKNLTTGKTIISSYHASKGCERDVVIVFNFDSSYFSFFGKSYNSSYCSNPLYVAITRAKKKLILIQNKNCMFNFIDKKSLSKFCHIYPLGVDILSQQSQTFSSRPLNKQYGITTLVRQQNFIDSAYFSSLFSFVSSQQLNPCNYSLPNRISGRSPDTFEDVSDFNGDIATIYFQFLTTSQIPIFSNNIIHLPSLHELNSRIQHHKLQIPIDLFYTVQIQYVIQNGYTHRLFQIKNWISQTHLDSIQQSLYSYFSPSNKNLLFEKKFSYFFVTSEILSIPYNTVEVTGYVDIIDISNKKIIEIKYVSQLLPYHYQQLFFYYVLINLSDSSYSDYSYEIFNLKSGEVLQLKISQNIPPLRTLLLKLICSNILSQGLSVSDQQFLDDISSYFNLVRSSFSSLDISFSQLKLDKDP